MIKLTEDDSEQGDESGYVGNILCLCSANSY